MKFLYENFFAILFTCTYKYNSANHDDYDNSVITNENNKIGYVRPIYHVTISLNQIKKIWFEKGKIVKIKYDSVFFHKVIEMEYKEIFDKNLEFFNNSISFFYNKTSNN